MMTDDQLKARFPGLVILHWDSREHDFYPGHIGWGVEWHGLRNAWLFKPECEDEIRARAIEWLERISHEQHDARPAWPAGYQAQAASQGNAPRSQAASAADAPADGADH